MTVEERIILYDIEPAPPDSFESVEPFLIQELQERGYAIPRGELNFEDKRFVWHSGKSYTVKYRASKSTEGKAYIWIEQKTLYGRMMSFHKGKVSNVLVWLGTAFAGLLIVSYLSGVYLAIKTPFLRVGSLVAFIVGSALLAWALCSM